MTFKQVKISRFNSSSPAVILVLFILLTIVVRIVPSLYANAGGDFSARATVGFDIVNVSSIPLRRTFIYGDFEQPTPAAYLPPGGDHHYEVEVVIFTDTAGTAIYRSEGTDIEVSFVLSNSAGWKLRNPDIPFYTTKGPIAAIKSSRTLLLISD
ncbi:hypothetical protein M3223_23175 [Paenibacillus pasadenensis]|uniref:hypothetical protein n=1 Tax=Paenibacillus pasadenensis TaxID=217090 RepID=UPI00203D3DA1|nr:hypothetical protein [Paenibacillus pasadenensis]MCM3750243.1 hypothetical protein [Paenibacillus pasadenensis]